MRSSDCPRQHIDNPRHAHHDHQLQANTSQRGSVTNTDFCHFLFQPLNYQANRQSDGKWKIVLNVSKMIRITLLTVPSLTSRRRASTDRTLDFWLLTETAERSRTAESQWDRRSTRKSPCHLQTRPEKKKTFFNQHPRQGKSSSCDLKHEKLIPQRHKARLMNHDSVSLQKRTKRWK